MLSVRERWGGGGERSHLIVFLAVLESQPLAALQTLRRHREGHSETQRARSSLSA
jgi:hypothetical protein